MKIAFGKIRHQILPFDVESDTYHFKGTLSLDKNDLVKLVSTLEIETEMQCDRCGEMYNYHHSDEFVCLISDGPFQGFEEHYDVIESNDGYVDLDAIAESELNLIKSDYNYCEQCKK